MRPIETKMQFRTNRKIGKIGVMLIGLGGNNGWYYGNILWKIRGILDQFMGGTGLRRGRRNSSELLVGDALDFWRVIYADKKQQKLINQCRKEVDQIINSKLLFEILNSDYPLKKILLKFNKIILLPFDEQ